MITVLQAPDGRYHVADGWTRTNAVGQLFGPEQRVPCTVQPCSSSREAARVFKRMNGDRIAPNALQLFATGVEGGDVLECAVAEVVASLGLHYPVAMT